MNSKQWSNINLRKYFKLGTKTNPIRMDRNAGFHHELTKLYMYCRLVYYGGHRVVINGKLLNGKIPDLVIVDTSEPFGFEIIGTETERMTINKDYPFKISRVKQIHFKDLLGDIL